MITTNGVVKIYLSTTSPNAVTYTWTVTQTGTVSGAMAGTGNIIDQVVTGTGTVIYSVTAVEEATLCSGNPVEITVTVDIDPVEFTATRSSDFQKNNCSGETGSFVTYSKNYTSFISQEDADQQAIDDPLFDTEGQNNANALGECFPPLPSDAVGIVVIDLYQAIDVCAFVDTPGVVPYQMPVYRGQNFLPDDGTPPANCWALASDLVTGGGSLDYRFEFNVARLINAYPAITDFVFKVRGRGVTSGTLNGAYSLKGAEAGNMIMTGSIGSYIPAVVSSSDLGIVPYSGKAYPSGADGNIGLAYGSDILVFTYNVAAKTLTL